MSVTLSGSVISFPPLSVEKFTPVHEHLNIFRYATTYNIEEITTIIDGEVKVAGLLIENAPDHFIKHVLIDVTRVMRFKVKK